ncbi:fibrillin [archaeon CG10_big_fil_rev_8_21_14_0_10_43_11]|nr:MAG: fibrillin [archaeon CG10_big_fil_rev_8_21_14_0_10_43_11]
MKLQQDKQLPGVYWLNNKLATKNRVRGQRVYGESKKRVGKDEYRMWDAKRSKLGAAIHNGARNLGLKDTSKVLYLGAASGTTVSHMSDMLTRGRIYAVEFAPRVMIQLINVAHKRDNLYPLLFDAHLPDEYAHFIEDVDVIFQDVAQRDQVHILIKNARVFLKKGGVALLALKARSVDVSKDPKDVFMQAEKDLKTYFDITFKVRLEPHEKDHMFFVLKKK